jgi:Beta-glucosidase-related glycosidases
MALSAAAALLLCAGCSQRPRRVADGPVYLDRQAPTEERIEDALSRMTLEEKVAVLHAQSKFSSAGVPRLGIPELWCTDGPHGIRPEVLWDEWEQAGWTSDSCVAFPALTCLAASWDPDLALLYGQSIGEEALYRGKDVLLGPGVNIYRTPLGGRNFEFMGEDPYLASRIVVPYVQGVQQNGVAACVKHFALNNEETHRHTIDVDLDDRALYEIYLPAFKAAVQEGGAWSIMSSYNLYRGTHVGNNERLLDDILRGEWGFDGAVISDWGGVHETEGTVLHGVDLEFGTWTDGLTMGATNAYDNYYLANPYLEGLRSGKYTVEGLDAKVRRVLRLIFRTAMREDKGFGALNSEAHYAAARRIGAEGIVLLKNENGLLPLRKGSRVLVVGENAVKMMTVGGGSSSLKVQHEISPFAGIAEQAQVTYARGYVGDVGGEYNGVSSGQDLSESRSPAQLTAEAVSLAREADYVVFVGGLNKSDHQDSEGADRLDLALPYGQDALISALAAANPRTVVALVSGNAVSMPWEGEVGAILQCWFLGSEAGHSIADVLFGDVNPSGKLPFTFPRALCDSPAHQAGMTFPNDGPTTYEEGIFVGYRWYDKQGIEPLFALGHGLSYTSFEYGPARLDRTSMTEGGCIRVSVPVTNTGSVPGKETVQLYIADRESSLPRPVKELKDFAKVSLEPAQTKTVTFEISADKLRFYDPAAGAWTAEPGEFELLIGSASDDIRTRAAFTLK